MRNIKKKITTQFTLFTIFTIFFLMIFLIKPAEAQTARWIEVPVKYNWDRSSTGFCITQTQCLFNNNNNETLNNQPNLYFSSLIPQELPKCIEDTQYFLDNYCDKGTWTSRTKQIAQQLISIALTHSPNDFTLYCDEYKKSLNNFDYISSTIIISELLDDSCTKGQRYIPCVNNFCILNYAEKTAFGVSLNTVINDADKTFLKALDKTRTHCNNALNNNKQYDLCGDKIWYNHDTESIIYTDLTTLPAITHESETFLKNNFETTTNLIFTQLHNPPQKNFNFFNQTTPSFRKTFFSKKTNKFIFGFKEKQITDTQTRTKIDYAGWHIHNTGLSTDFCSIIEKYRGNCGTSGTDLFIAGKTETLASIADKWEDLSGRLRLT